jgi:hypothetical protein
MIRVASLLSSCLLIGCATVSPNDPAVGEWHQSRSVSVGDDMRALAPTPSSEQPTASTLSIESVDAAPESWSLTPAESAGHNAFSTGSATGLSLAAPAATSAPALDEGLRASRFTIKGGLYTAEDEDALDDGYIFTVSWMRFFTEILALEFEAGYFNTDGEDSGVDAEAWGIPLMVNGRLNLPVWVVDLYGGLGVGTIYYDAEADAGLLSIDDDGFLLAGNAFLGGTINVADRVALGLEAKYYATDEIDDLDDAKLDAFALMLTLGFSR